MVVCVECLPADKPWDVVSATRRSSDWRGAAGLCARVRARVLVPPNLYIHACVHYLYTQCGVFVLCQSVLCMHVPFVLCVRVACGELWLWLRGPPLHLHPVCGVLDELLRTCM